MRTKQNNNNKQIIIQNMKLYTIVLVAIANGPKKRCYDGKKPFCLPSVYPARKANRMCVRGHVRNMQIEI